MARRVPRQSLIAALALAVAAPASALEAPPGVPVRYSFDDASRARERYQQALCADPAARQLLLKLSYVHFLLGDADGDRALRERIYGSLLGRR